MSAKVKKEASASLKNFTILIAEDYPFMSDLLGGMLRAYGVGRIQLAESGADARDFIRFSNSHKGSTGQIDMVLVDWLMPNGSGVDLLQWMRSHKSPSIKFLPAILISAYTNEEVVRVARDNGANEALVKPVSAQSLANRILHVINHPRPFVKAPGFFGPERRRQEKEFQGEDKRQPGIEMVKEHHERI